MSEYIELLNHALSLKRQLNRLVMPWDFNSYEELIFELVEVCR